jgi:hypothetical protein
MCRRSDPIQGSDSESTKGSGILAGWFSKAAAVLGKSAPPPPQPFDIPCDCGERLTGWRTDSHQKLSCPQCDRLLLVLPADVYPAVKRAKTAPAAKAAPTVVQPDDSSDVRGKKSSGKKSGKSRSKDPPAPAAETASKTKEAKPAPEDRVDLSPVLQQAKARRRSLRLVVASILALVAVTGWSLYQRTQRERARSIIPTATETGMAALRSGDFATASRELTAAVQALDILHQTDAAAQTIRQAQREAAAAYGLVSSGLAELATEVLSGVGTQEERQRRFQAEYGAKWIILDAGVVSRPVSNTTIYELDVPLLVDNQVLQLSCDFPDLRRRFGKVATQTPVRVIFAVQLDDWLIPDTQTQPIVARIKPATAFLWTDYDSFQAIGYRPDSPDAEQETRSLLHAQRQREAVQ